MTFWTAGVATATLLTWRPIHILVIPISKAGRNAAEEEHHEAE
jgi:hypothetical protein